MTSVAEAGRTQFDEFFAVGEYSRYLPARLAEGYAAEGKARSSRILEQLADDPSPPSQEKLRHTLERLKAFEDTCYYADLKLCVSISLSLWRLVVRCGAGRQDSSALYSYSLLRALIGHLKDWLRRIRTDFRTPAWLAQPGHAEIEELARLRKELDASMLFRMIVMEMGRSRREDFGTPDGSRRAFVHDVANLLCAMRDFVDAEASKLLAAEITKYLDGRYVHVMLFSRVLVVLTPQSRAAEALESGQLWTWWSSMPEGLVPKFDLMWFAFLGRYAKQRWMNCGGNQTRNDAAEASLRRHLPWILNKVYRTLNLPFCSPSAGALDNAKELQAVPELDRYSIPNEIDANVMGAKTNWAKVAKFIVYMLDAEPPNDANDEQDSVAVDPNNAWNWLALLLRQLTPFLQPGSASGEWHFHGLTLIQNIVQHYFKRSGRERLLNTAIPSERCLGRAADEKFVALVLPLVSYSLQSVNPMVMLSSLEVFTQLSQLAAAFSPALEAWAAPQPFAVDVPSILGKALEALNDPAEAGKHAALFQIFGRALPAILLRWPSLLNDVFQVVLWGIDVSDLPKTLSSLALITTIFTHIPCVDINDWPNSDYGAAKCAEGAKRRWPIAGPRDPSCDIESSAMIVSSMLPAFAMEYFERICEFVTKMPKPTKNAGGFMDKVEDSALGLLHAATHLIAAQCSTSTYTRLLEALRDFVSTNLLNDQAKSVSAIVSAVVRVDPKTALPVVFPKVFSKLKPSEMKSLNGDLSESEAKWYLSVLLAAVRHSGEHLLGIRRELEDIVRGALMDDRDDIVKLGAKLLRRILFTITSTYIRSDFRICGAETWRALTSGSKASSTDSHWPLKWWGWTSPWWHQETLSIEWHEPMDAEVAWARELVQGVLAQVAALLPSSPDSVVAPLGSPNWLEGFEVPTKKRASHKLKVGLMVTRAVLRGICGLWLDEREEGDLRESLMPNVSAHEAEMGKVVFGAFARSLLATARALSHDECGRDCAKAEPLPTGIEPVEVAGLLSKVFECMEVLLRAPGCASSASSHLLSANLRGHSHGHGMLSLFLQYDHTPVEYLHEESRWRGLPRIWWTLTVADLLDARHRDRCQDHRYEGWRKDVLDAICDLAFRASSASVRDSARGLLVAAIPHHVDAGYALLRNTALPALPKETAAALNCGSLVGEAAEKEELRLNGTLDGLSRLVGSSPFMQGAWRHGEDDAAALGLALVEGIYAVTRVVVETGTSRAPGEKRCELKASTMATMVVAAHHLVENRELQTRAMVRPEQDQFSAERSVKVVETIEQLLGICSRKDSHWRAQVVSTAMILALRGSLGQFQAPVGKEQYVRDVGLQLAKWFVSCCELKNVPPLQSLGVHGLSLMLKRPAPLVGDDLKKVGLLGPEFVEKLLEVLPKLHHASLLNAGGTGGHDADPTEHTVRSMTSSGAFRSWPFIWGGRTKGTFSVRNALFWQSFVVFYASNASAEDLGASLGKAAEFFAQKPNSEQEYHAAMPEFFAGALRALRKDAFGEHAARAWAVMHKWLSSEIQAGSQDRLSNWCYAVRFIVAGTSQPMLRSFTKSFVNNEAPVTAIGPGSNRFLVPLFNFVLSPDELPDLKALRSSFAPLLHVNESAPDTAQEGDQVIVQEESSFAVFKRLRLLVSLIVEPCAIAMIRSEDAFCGNLFVSLRTGLGHPYKQLREEAARSVVILLRGLKGSPCNVANNVVCQMQAWLSKEAERLQKKLREDSVAQQSDAGAGAAGRKRHVLESSGLCYVILHAALERLTASLLGSVVPNCLAFLLAASTHGDFELRGLAVSALATCGAAHLATPADQGTRPWCDLATALDLVRLLRVPEADGGLTFKERDKAIFMVARPVLIANAFALRSWTTLEIGGDCEDLFKALRQLVREALGHPQHEVRNAAKSTLISVMTPDSPAEAKNHLKHCRALAPAPKRGGTKPPDPSADVLAGVVGLSCALLVAANLGAPSWVGKVVESIAPHGRSGVADIVRKEVQGTIQTFLKMQQSRQQTWKEFQEKVSPAQLDLLNDFKGKLTYFS